MNIFDAAYRKQTATHHSERFKNNIKSIFQQLCRQGTIKRYRLGNESFRNQYLEYNISYECVFKVIEKEEKTVIFSFLMDMREREPKTVEQKFTSVMSRFHLSHHFDKDILSANIRKRITQWTRGLKNELDFTEFLKRLASSDDRIQAYKTKDHDDMRKGIDFVVSFFRKPDWERCEVKFNLKSSDYFLDQHKLKHPTVGTFVFRSNLHFNDYESRKQLRHRFFKFLVLSSKSTEAIHM